jgi:hypothetical protein
VPDDLCGCCFFEAEVGEQPARISADLAVGAVEVGEEVVE